MKKVLFLLLLLIFTCPVLAMAEQININSATLSQLDELTGIGPTYAQRIIDNRPYSSVDDLDRVKGIGPATLQKIKNQGFACVNCQPTQAVVQPTSQTTATTQTLATAPNTATNNPTPSTTPVIYPTGVFINEILPNPEGADEKDEWIELCNSNNFDVDLSGWQLQDKAGTITTYPIPQGTKILAGVPAVSGSFLIFKRPATQIMLNNDGDEVNLLAPNGKVINSVGFLNAPLGQSYNKTANDWTWSTTLTPGAVNVITTPTKKQSTTPTPKIAQPGLSKTKNSVKNDVVTPELAGLSQSVNLNQDNSSTNPWFLFFTVLATTIILGSVIIFIKVKILKTHVRT